MSVDEYKARFAFEISEEQKNRADKLISQYGLRRAIFSHILNDVLDMIDEFGPVVIGILMSDKVKPRDIVPTLKRAADAGKEVANVRS